jgi:hypothetical protein
LEITVHMLECLTDLVVTNYLNLYLSVNIIPYHSFNLPFRSSFLPCL